MTFRPERILAHDFGELRQTYDARDAILYALGVGLGPGEEDLAYLDETRLQVLPPFAPTLASPGMWIRDPAFGVSFDKLVHLAQDATFLSPLPSSGTVIGTAAVASLSDRGEGRGAVLVLERAIRDAERGTLYATVRQTLLLRGDGGFGGVPAERTRRRVPERAPDLVASTPLSRRAALIYRLSGDRNPLHLDPQFARRAGFPAPILHGLCTYATIGIAVARACGADPSAIRRLAARFAGVVFPGDVVTVKIWREDASTIFTADVGDRTVLDDGLIEL
ncbi:MaoC/PaaZ C-terminal domain-containing protein [Sphingomonas floccifaciens]|uniref:MaoC/PaaZ C-terminal domain-containing protein n=1 Tax=Sphingomonas floccifaciens TaxID=1844115 RepID=A0ABW4NHV7_9SPHN